MGLGVAVAVNGVLDETMACATNVQVSERVGSGTTYQLTYPTDIWGGDLPWLVDGRLAPRSEFAVLVPLGDHVHCLVVGPVSGQRVHLEHGGAGSTIEVSGTDTLSKMDRKTRRKKWNNVTDADVARAILGGKEYGYELDVADTKAKHIEDKHSLNQDGTDLQLLRKLARRNGYQLWVTCKTVDGRFVETAHFREPIRTGEPAVALSMNVPAPCIDVVDFNWDVERPVAVQGTQINLKTLGDIGGGVAGVKKTALAAASVATLLPAQSMHLVVPVDDAGELQARNRAALAEANWFLRGSCQTTVEKLGALVRPHTLTEIKGAGTRYSGTYFVSAVTHTIDVTEHRMNIELMRDGWGTDNAN